MSLSRSLLVPFWMTWLKPRCFLVPVFPQPLIIYFCCMSISKTYCFRDRFTFCRVFNKSGRKSLNSSEVPEFSRNADHRCLYTSDYRGEDHTIFFFLLLPAIVFSSPYHPYLLKIPLHFCLAMLRSPPKFSSCYCHAPLKLSFIEERLIWLVQVTKKWLLHLQLFLFVNSGINYSFLTWRLILQ